jgi:predicted RNase H-like HicB family nuclease
MPNTSGSDYYFRQKKRNCRSHANAYPPTMTLKAMIHEAEEGGFWAEVASLPGCVAQAESISELEVNIHEAVEGWLLAAEPEDGTLGGRILEVAV